MSSIFAIFSNLEAETNQSQAPHLLRGSLIAAMQPLGTYDDETGLIGRAVTRVQLTYFVEQTQTRTSLCGSTSSINQAHYELVLASIDVGNLNERVYASEQAPAFL